MTQLLDMQTMKSRIAACLAFETSRGDSGIRMEFILNEPFYQELNDCMGWYLNEHQLTLVK